MNQIIQFLIVHGYSLILAWIFSEQIGIPIPSAPMLLAAGALAGAGDLDLIITLGIAVTAALSGNLIWYLIGRMRGVPVLNLLCRISLNPGSCIRGAAEMFSHHGTRSLIFAKFIPGLSTIVPPLAGIFRMNLGKFILLDAVGSFLWVGCFAGLGYLFSDQIEFLALYALRLGAFLGVMTIGVLGAYLTWKYVERRRFLRELRMARITPEDLKRKLDAGEGVTIIDVRHSLEVESDPQMIPGALYVPLEQFEFYDPNNIPRDREIVLYCD